MTKTLSIIMLLLFGTKAWSQDLLKSKTSGLSITKPYSETDTIPKVIFLDNDMDQTTVSVYLNGGQVPYSLLNTLKPEKIAEVTVEKKKIPMELYILH